MFNVINKHVTNVIFEIIFSLSAVYFCMIILFSKELFETLALLLLCSRQIKTFLNWKRSCDFIDLLVNNIFGPKMQVTVAKPKL